MKVLKKYLSLISGTIILSLLVFFLLCPIVKFKMGNNYNSTTTYIRGIDALMGGNIIALKVQKYQVFVDNIPKTEVIKSYVMMELNFNIWILIFVIMWLVFGLSLLFYPLNKMSKNKTFIGEMVKILIVCTASLLLSFIPFGLNPFLMLLIGLISYVISSFSGEEGPVFFGIMGSLVSIITLFSGALFNYVNELTKYVLSNELIIIFVLNLMINIITSLFVYKNKEKNKSNKF